MTSQTVEITPGSRNNKRCFKFNKITKKIRHKGGVNSIQMFSKPKIFPRSLGTEIYKILPNPSAKYLRIEITEVLYIIYCIPAYNLKLKFILWQYSRVKKKINSANTHMTYLIKNVQFRLCHKENELGSLMFEKMGFCHYLNNKNNEY